MTFGAPTILACIGHKIWEIRRVFETMPPVVDLIMLSKMLAVKEYIPTNNLFEDVGVVVTMRFLIRHMYALWNQWLEESNLPFDCLPEGDILLDQQFHDVLVYLREQVFQYDESKKLFLLRDVVKPLSEVKNDMADNELLVWQTPQRIPFLVITEVVDPGFKIALMAPRGFALVPQHAKTGDVIYLLCNSAPSFILRRFVHIPDSNQISSPKRTSNSDLRV